MHVDDGVTDVEHEAHVRAGADVDVSASGDDHAENGRTLAPNLADHHLLAPMWAWWEGKPLQRASSMAHCDYVPHDDVAIGLDPLGPLLVPSTPRASISPFANQAPALRPFLHH